MSLLRGSFAFLEGTVDYDLKYIASEISEIFVYGDSDWANEVDRKSISGSLFFNERI